MPNPVTPQFKLYASKFPIWWTHNSIDKPDPTYFEHLNDGANKDGFSWVEVPFTFNFKNQFEGTLIVDNQYYTYFKLVDLKDEKFPNRYYLVEAVSKAFNGGYEISIRLDVFTTYGLDFWVNGVNNPDISSKTVNLNRTNHGQLLLDNYYNYSQGTFQLYNDFNNWCYLDPLLKFDSLPEVNLVASFYGYRMITDINLNKDVRVNYVPWNALTQIYNINWNSDHWDLTTTSLSSTYIINGNGDVSYSGMLTSMVRYYVFKPLIGDDDQYWAIWTIAPRMWGIYPNNTLRAGSTDSTKPSFNFRADANAVLETFIHSDKGFANKLIGVFEAPPLTALANWSYAPEASSAPASTSKPYMLESCALKVNNTNTFLMTKIFITPDRISGFSSQGAPTTNNTYFSIINILNPGQNALDKTLKDKLFSRDNEIRFINESWETNSAGGKEWKLYNNAYIIQKCKIANLQYTPFYPGGVYQYRNMLWENALQQFNLPTHELAEIKIPDVVFFTTSGFRFGYISNFMSINKTLWTFPSSIPVGTDDYAQYMASVLLNQNTSIAIAKQQRDLGIADAVIGGVSSMAGGAISGGAGGILGAITGLANMGTNIARNELAYQNKQKTLDAQNATARATMSTTVNNSVDADTATQIFNTGLYIRDNPNIWQTTWNLSFNWIINAKLPTLPRDIIYYNNLIYLNGFFVDTQVQIRDLALDWNNHFSGLMPHLYYDVDIPLEIIKYHYKALNTELLNAVNILFNNGIRFWPGFPNYSKPWYWIPAPWADYH